VSALSLYPYQQRAVRGVREALTRGLATLRASGETRGPRALLVLPTGGGKGTIIASLAISAAARGKRVLTIVHRREIVLDIAKRVRSGDMACGVILAGEPRTEALVQVAGVATMDAREIDVDADLVIVDEAHHAVAATWAAITARNPRAHVVGLTATPVRSDGQGLKDAFDELVVGSTIAELVGLGVLAPVDVVGPARRQSALSMAPFEAWQQHAGGRPTVAFCATIAESRALVAALTEQGVAAAHVDGDTSRRRRDAILEDFSAGRLDVVSNVAVLTEGWDCARAEVILLARGCDSPGTLLQTIGRGRRFGDDASKRCLLVDLCGAVHQHGMPDAPRDWTLDGLRAPAKGSADAIRQCPECGAVYLVAEHPRACPAGHVPPPQPEREVKPAPVSFITSTVPRAELQAEFDRLSQLARERRWKPNAVPVLFKQRFGFWPARMRETRRVA
jgi:superfamily II DNA or RNA helicase